MAEEVDYDEDVDMGEGLKVSVATDAKGSSGRKVTVKTKGRGHNKGGEGDDAERYNGRGGVFENIQRGSGAGPLQCKYIMHIYEYQSCFDRKYWRRVLYSNRRMDLVRNERPPRSSGGRHFGQVL